MTILKLALNTVTQKNKLKIGLNSVKSTVIASKFIVNSLVNKIQFIRIK